MATRQDDFERMLSIAEKHAQTSLLAEQNERARESAAEERGFDRGRRQGIEEGVIEGRRLAQLEAVAVPPMPPRSRWGDASSALAEALADGARSKALVAALAALLGALAGHIAGPAPAEVSAANAAPVVEVPHAP